MKIKKDWRLLVLTSLSFVGICLVIAAFFAALEIWLPVVVALFWVVYTMIDLFLNRDYWLE